MLFNPYAAGALALALLLSHGWAFVQGKNFEKRAEIARVEATNARIRAVNAREEAVAAKEAEQRDAAFTNASAVLLRAGKCFATPEVAAALSGIK